MCVVILMVTPLFVWVQLPYTFAGGDADLILPEDRKFLAGRGAFFLTLLLVVLSRAFN